MERMRSFNDADGKTVPEWLPAMTKVKFESDRYKPLAAC